MKTFRVQQFHAPCVHIAVLGKEHHAAGAPVQPVYHVDGGISQVAQAPALGFLFPAFDNRSTNIYNALYYTHSTKESHEDFVTAVFNTQVPKPAEEQTDPTYHREHAVSLLQEAFDRITLRLEAERAQKAEVKLFKTLQEERFYTVEEKMDLLTETLRRVPRITFDSLFTDVHSRGEVVAIFLSVLEAVRFGFVDVFRENEDTLWLSLVKE